MPFGWCQARTLVRCAACPSWSKQASHLDDKGAVSEGGRLGDGLSVIPAVNEPSIWFSLAASQPFSATQRSAGQDLFRVRRR